MSENAENESLDSFFAKKDKVKKKSTKTRITPDDIGQLQEKKLQKAAKKAKKESQSEMADSNNHKNHQASQYEDEEWKVIDEEKEEKEMTELKIQNLNLITKVDVDTAGGDDGEDDNNNLNNDPLPGPWKSVSANLAEEKETVTQTHIQADKPQEVPKPPVTETESEEVKPTKCIPPGARSQVTETESEEVKPKKYVPPGARSQVAETESEEVKPTKYVPPGARGQGTVTESKPEAVAGVKQKYVPPGARNLGGTRTQQGIRRKKALDVSSVDDFPSLAKN